jgi:ribonuclease P protein component
MRNRRGLIRYGITTGKKVGCAVMRNRARRIIDAAVRECLKNVDCSGADIVFVARTKTPFLKSTDIEKAIRKSFEAEGLYQSEISSD